MSNGSEPNSRIPLLEFTYKEVLDATKHQDDKIGRLFAGIAFLTAAALAVANLGTADYLIRKFDVGIPVPLGLFFLLLFLFAVIVTVTLLINSFATPLRLPGLRPRTGKPNIQWATTQAKASQIYFTEISGLTLDQWRAKWRAGLPLLEREKRDSLVEETHNLAVRTSFKYRRTTEAVAVFSLGLLFLALTMTCIVSAATIAPRASATFPHSPIGPIHLPPPARVAIGAVFAVFAFLQLNGQVRYTRQAIDDLLEQAKHRAGALLYAWVIAASLWIFIVGAGWSNRTPMAKILAAITLFGLFCLWRGSRLRRPSRKATHTPSSGFKVRSFVKRRKLEIVQVVLLLPVLVLGVLPLWIAYFKDSFLLEPVLAVVGGNSYLLALVLALLGAFLLTIYAALGPTLVVHRSLSEHKERIRRG